MSSLEFTDKEKAEIQEQIKNDKLNRSKKSSRGVDKKIFNKLTKDSKSLEPNTGNGIVEDLNLQSTGTPPGLDNVSWDIGTPNDLNVEWQDKPIYEGQVNDRSASMPGAMRFSRFKTYFFDLTNPSERDGYDRVLGSQEDSFCNFEIVNNRIDFDSVNGRYIALITTIEYKFRKIQRKV